METVVKPVQAWRRRSRRGFSLIEVAVALAVVGLLLGGMLVPVGDELRKKAYVKTHAQMADAIEAIVGYAASSRSQGMLIGYANGYDIDGDESVRAYFGVQFAYVPAGRPYLPCPDIDNDGLEDRYGTDSTKPRGFLEVPALLNTDSFSVLDYYGVGTGAAERLPVYFEISRLEDPSIEMPAFGECRLHFGNLPWKTLLLPAADAWGSMFTYVVHPNFSTSGFGFDQHTRASVFPLYSRPDIESSSGGDIGALIGSYERARTPILVCDYYAESNHLRDNSGHRYGPCSSARTDPGDTSLDPTHFRGTHTAGGNRLHNLVDDIFDGGSSQPLARANYVGHVMPVYNVITDGIAFAVISHGSDRGGARSAATGNCFDLPGDDSQVTNLSPGVYAQKQNALYGSCENSLMRVDNPRHDPRGFERRASSFRHDEYEFDKSFTNIGARLDQDLFVSQGIDDAEESEVVDIFGSVVALGRGGTAPPGQRRIPSYAVGSGDDRFDDVVGWLTRRELADRLHDAGVFPVAYYPGLLPEGVPVDLSGL